ncbi:MAG TPA: sigma-70 family RNA polymerase sigma factor [Polyangiaceae bacterium]|nr:sigma-70 family RNA polymerase sigma factor [Polyangiaceae bacterium]
MGDTTVAAGARAPDQPDACLASALAPEALVPHLPFVWRVLRGLGVPAADLDDATQRVFMIVASKIAQVRPGSERAYLFTTATRVASWIRRQGQRLDLVDDAELGLHEDPEPGPDERADRRRALALLEEILARLPEELRLVFILCELEELTAPEAADVLAIPSGTVASRLRRARQSVSDHIQRARLRARRGAPR